jgi:hypothetical protein
MIVHDGGDVWQVVLQTHHADLAEQFARAWGNADFAAPDRRDSMAIAARRHDDGWAVWERSPRVAVAESPQRPVPFLEVHITSHLAFYEAGIVDVTDEDAYAGLLCAMHGAGIYRQRYGTQPGLKNKWADDYGAEIDRFVETMESSYPQRLAETGAEDGPALRADYRLLQAFDRLSLYFSGLFPLKDGDRHEIAPVPTDAAGGEVTIAVETASGFEPLAGVQRARIDPYPFAERGARFQLKRFVIAKGDCTAASLTSMLLDGEPEEVELLIE